MYPKIEIQTAGIIQNLTIIQKLAAEQGVKVSVVTKGLAGAEDVVRLLIENGADSICESNVINLKKFENFDVEKWLIRPPMISRAADAVHYSDISLNSEITTIRALGDAAVSQNKRHKVVIMVELGETREGVMPDDALALCKEVMTIPGIELAGLGNQLSCYSGIIPGDQNMTEFVRVVRDVEAAIGLKLPYISGGNSTSLYMLQKRVLPKEINHLRIGEAIIIGMIPNYCETIRGGQSNNFTLHAEIVEIKDKPSKPYGDRAPCDGPISEDEHFPDKGIRKRAILAVGSQDIAPDHMKPVDPGLEMLECCSDCFVIDITDSKIPYAVGDVITFSTDYYGTVRAMASKYIEKILL